MGLLDWLKQIGGGRKKLPYRNYVRISCLTSYPEADLEKFIKDPKKIPKELPVKNAGMIQFYKQSIIEAPEKFELEMALKVKRLHLKSLEVAQKGLDHGDPLEVAAEILTINPFDFTTVVGVGTAYNQAKRARDFKVADYIKDTLNAYLKLHGKRTTFEEIYVYYDPRFRARDMDPGEVDAKIASKKMAEAEKAEKRNRKMVDDLRSRGQDIPDALLAVDKEVEREESDLLSSAAMVSKAVSIAGERQAVVRPELVEPSVADSDDSSSAAQIAAAVHAAHTSPEITAELLDTGIPSGLILDGCKIERIAGKGGMGIVYKARHEHLDRDVAVKVLSKDFSANKDQVRRFQEEARAAAKIEHPNIIAVYNFGICADRPYMVMQWIEGGSMQHLLDKLKGQPMDVPDALRLIAQAARGLHAAHKISIVHRDIKPDNLLVTEENLVKIADFGLAKQVEADLNLSVTGMVLGTPAYIPPEQVQGETVDFRADIYSLGVTLFHAVTGTVPFKGALMRVLYAHMTEPLPSARLLNPQISPELDEFIQYMTAKQPGDRPQSMEEVADTLDIFLNPSLRPSSSDADIPLAAVHAAIPEAEAGNLFETAGVEFVSTADFNPPPADPFFHDHTLADAPAPIFAAADPFADPHAMAPPADPFADTLTDPFGAPALDNSAAPNPFADPTFDAAPADPFGAPPPLLDPMSDPFADTVTDTPRSDMFETGVPDDGFGDEWVRETAPIDRDSIAAGLSAVPASLDADDLDPSAFAPPSEEGGLSAHLSSVLEREAIGLSPADDDDIAATLAGNRSSGSGSSTGSDFGAGGEVSSDVTPKSLEAGLQPGQIIGGCRIERILGKGGMGIVYLAVQEQLDRKVALKVLNAEISQNEIQLRRFKEEARAAAKLEHPNIIQVHTFGIVHEHPYLVMQFIEGESLQDRIKRDGPLPVPDLVEFFTQAAEGLSAAHKRGIIHRDVKPDNFMITRDGVIKVADFGLAKQAEAEKISVTGTVLGTPAYMAPEQVRNESGDIDGRADVYALGMALFHAATGTVPFKGALVQVLFAQINQPLPDPRTLRPDLPDSLITVIQKMCQKDPAERYQTMDDVKKALALAFDPEAFPAAPAEHSSTVEIAKGLASFDWDDDAGGTASVPDAAPAEANNPFAEMDPLDDAPGFGDAPAPLLGSPISGRMPGVGGGPAGEEEAPDPFAAMMATAVDAPDGFASEDAAIPFDGSRPSDSFADAPGETVEALTDPFGMPSPALASPSSDDALANPFASDAPDFAGIGATAPAVGTDVPDALPAESSDAASPVAAPATETPSTSESETAPVEAPAEALDAPIDVSEAPSADPSAPTAAEREWPAVAAVPEKARPMPEPVVGASASPRLAWELIVTAVGGVFLLLASCSPLTTTPERTRQAFSAAVAKLELSKQPPSPSRTAHLQTIQHHMQVQQVPLPDSRDDLATDAAAEMSHLVGVSLADSTTLSADEAELVARRTNFVAANPTPWNVARLMWLVRANAEWFGHANKSAAGSVAFVLMLMPMVAMVLIALPFMFHFRGRPWLAWGLIGVGIVQILALFFVVVGNIGTPVGGAWGSGAWFALFALFALAGAVGIIVRSLFGSPNKRPTST